MVGVHAMSAMLDRCPGSDPVGAIFEETLEALGPLDRELLLFCATTNIVAVRWLLYLGARWDAQDSNGSTCLHVACRAGSIQVVTDLLSYSSLLHTSDVARWTPLHIATFMGRREAVARLLRARANPDAQNLARQSPADLCPDCGTLTAFRESVEDLENEQDSSIPDEAAGARSSYDDTVGAPLECEHIPFFLPPVSAIRCGNRHDELWAVGVLIFNKQPSYGLAFVVACGLASTYADALLKILSKKNVNRGHVGGFLGEALSLSFLTRLSLFDSIPLWNTGVVAALRSVFAVFQLPEDFQKINRLLAGVAQVWWRKHKVQGSPEEFDDEEDALKSDLVNRSMSCLETSGSQLKASLGCLDALTQLMFSTVLLHWFLHGDGSKAHKKEEFSMVKWNNVNRGLGSGGGDLDEHILEQIHGLICHSFMKELALSAPVDDAFQGEAGEVCWERLPSANAATSVRSHHSPDEGAGLARASAWQSALSSRATLEGWVQHCPIGSRQIHYGLPSSMSEVPFSLTSAAPGIQFGPGRNSLDSAMGEASRTESLFLQPKKDSKIWLTLCDSLLFFWAGAAQSSATPHMFLDLHKTQVLFEQGSVAQRVNPQGRAAPSISRGQTSTQRKSNVVSLIGAVDSSLRKVPRKEEKPIQNTASKLEQEIQKKAAESAAQSAALHLTSRPHMFVSVIHLLPDGRWQELHLARLELWFANEFEAEVWASRLSGEGDTLAESLARQNEAAKSVTSPRVMEAELIDIHDSQPFPCTSDVAPDGDLLSDVASDATVDRLTGAEL